MLIKVHKDKLTFKNNFLKTEKGREAQKHGDYYKQIKASIEKQGILNPLICVQDGDMYKICLGIKRYIIGCDLGMKEFEIKVIPKDESKFLKEENAKYLPTDADNAYYKSLKIAHPQYQLFKNRLVLKQIKDLILIHKPIEKSINRVKGQMEQHGLLCPIVLSPSDDNLIQTGTNRFLELQRQQYDATLCYRPIDAHEAKFMQVVNVLTLKHHPFEKPSFIYDEDMLKIYGQNIGNFLNLLNENGLYDR